MGTTIYLTKKKKKKKGEKVEFFFSLKFLHGIRARAEPFNPFMTKYKMATKDSLTSEVTSTQKAPIPSNNGGSDGVVVLITKHKLNGQNYLQWSQRS